jgi:hypothetical protein
MERICRSKISGKFIKSYVITEPYKKLYNKCGSDYMQENHGTEYPFSGLHNFVESLILCGVQEECIQRLTGLPKESVVTLFQEAEAGRNREFKESLRALAMRRRGKLSAGRS